MKFTKLLQRKKILVIQLAGIGDTLMSIPAIKEVTKEKNNSVDILVMYSGSKDILKNQKIGVERIIQFNMIKEGAIRTIKFCLKLRKEKYDLIINLAPQARIHYDIVAKLIGGKKIIGFNYGNGKIHSFSKKLLLDDIKGFDYTKHITKQNLELVGGKEIENIRLIIPKQDTEKIRKEIKNIKGIKVGIHIGSGTTKNLYLKRWPIEHWEKLISMLVKEKLNVLLFGSEENKENNKLKEKFGTKVFVMDKSDLNETSAEINECDLFISADSLLMHIANALNKKQIVIAGPALDKTIEYSRKNMVVLKSKLLCQPCYKYGKYLKCTNKNKFACVKEIYPEQVFLKVKDILR